MSNVSSLLFRKNVKESQAMLNQYLSETKAILDNPRFPVGFINVTEAVLTAVEGFNTNVPNWAPLLSVSTHSGPDEWFQSLFFKFHSGLSTSEEEPAKEFMSICSGLSREWEKSVETIIEGMTPTPSEDIVHNMSNHFNGGEIINNFAFIEFGVVASLSARGYTFYELLDSSNKKAVIVAKSDTVSILIDIYHQVHIDDDKFIRENSKEEEA